MNNMNLRTTFIAFLLLFSGISLSAQCPANSACGTGVTNDAQLAGCLAATNLAINITADNTFTSNHNLSDAALALGNNVDIRFTGNVTVNSCTRFSASTGNTSIQVGPIIITSNSGGGNLTITQLNGLLALIPTGTTTDIATVLSLLPVEFISFTGKAEKGNAMLHWATATESNNKQFEVEHSLDGKQFKTIEIIPGGGTSFERLDYSFEHKAVPSGLNYYRLRQVDYDETYAYSDVISIQLSGRKVDYNVFPNPSKGTFAIVTESGLAPTQIQLYNTLGQALELVPNESGNYSLPQSVQRGTYILKLQIEGATHFERLLIQ